MHESIKGRLEEYLRGTSDRETLREFELHLESCESCRSEVRRMQEHSLMLKALRAPAESEPGPGFYGRVMERIESQRRSSIWGIFMQPVFGRRIVFATLVALLFLGGYLISTEMDQSLTASAPEAILAGEEPAPPLGADRDRDRDAVLVNLTTYGP